MREKTTILLVDDSETDLLLMRRAFKQANADARLQEVNNGEEAIAYLKGERVYDDREQYPFPTVVLLDLNMPMKNGFEVLAWVRAQPILRRLSIIVLTTSERVEDVERAFDAGAQAYLVKPATMQGLIAMIRSLCDWLQYNQFPPLKDAVRKMAQR